MLLLGVNLLKPLFAISTIYFWLAQKLTGTSKKNSVTTEQRRNYEKNQRNCEKQPRNYKSKNVITKTKTQLRKNLV